VPHLRRVTILTALCALSLMAAASPASAQQLIDASHDGDLAFIAFAFMCFVFVGLLFSIDKVRSRRGRQ
jgi:ABC-type Na+ efflux pump permease subunit